MIISDANSCSNITTKQSKNQSKNICYIYRHIRLDKNEVFYIGKGTNTNGRYKRSKSTHRSNPHWHNVVNKCEYKIEIVVENLSEQEANKKEVELILFYGRRDLGTGTLVNMTAGGEGTSGYKRRKHTEETLEKMRGKKRSEEARRKIGENKKGNTNWLGKKHTEETRKKMSESQSRKKVGQYKDDVLIKEYPSVQSTKLDGFNPSHVGACCRGVLKTHKKYQWKFL